MNNLNVCDGCGEERQCERLPDELSREYRIPWTRENVFCNNCIRDIAFEVSYLRAREHESSSETADGSTVHEPSSDESGRRSHQSNESTKSSSRSGTSSSHGSEGRHQEHLQNVGPELNVINLKFCDGCSQVRRCDRLPHNVLIKRRMRWTRYNFFCQDCLQDIAYETICLGVREREYWQESGSGTTSSRSSPSRQSSSDERGPTPRRPRLAYETPSECSTRSGTSSSHGSERRHEEHLPNASDEQSSDSDIAPTYEELIVQNPETPPDMNAGPIEEQNDDEQNDVQNAESNEHNQPAVIDLTTSPTVSPTSSPVSVAAPRTRNPRVRDQEPIPIPPPGVDEGDADFQQRRSNAHSGFKRNNGG